MNKFYFTSYHLLRLDHKFFIVGMEWRLWKERERVWSRLCLTSGLGAALWGHIIYKAEQTHVRWMRNTVWTLVLGGVVTFIAAQYSGYRSEIAKFSHHQ